jgi:hypothetical protein
MKLKCWLSAVIVFAVLADGAWAEEKPRDAKGQVCRMEQQCH